ncbi:MAG: hypothetical protein GEEBNDBF_00572 [bacterium]|nr:hypothetical protein [bacterium]
MSLLTPTAVLHQLLDAIWPPFCPGCQALVQHRSTCCGSCQQALPWLTPPFCAICGESLTGAVGVCRRCERDQPAFRGGRSALVYDGVVQRVILAWKYEGVRYYEPLLSGWFREFLCQLPSERYRSLDAILPVPLHPRRLHWRGFNQATCLAQVAGGVWELPVWQGLLIRTKFTPPQQRVGARSGRTRNLQGAFLVTDPELVVGRRLLLVDDVATTGSTLHECAVNLRRAGAKSVTFVTLARQQSPKKDQLPAEHQELVAESV